MTFNGWLQSIVVALNEFSKGKLNIPFAVVVPMIVVSSTWFLDLFVLSPEEHDRTGKCWCLRLNFRWG
ncbi:hypothetical protein CH366_10315 [Leptospira harrisiae]|uniref:Uncharacterized protein n=1 Tax=Leptospira harrisiae TaxID=2023189 RepID=A0A2N0AHG6_9LEPT|nr:hypothetical protein CH364_15945 [Leptospira harrisiae]PKA06857.1 hypothetical protein CH366_10315 [Leptospira harrisiae]